MQSTADPDLLKRANPSGGWGYYAAKSSRIEPTCWSLLALAAEKTSASTLQPHAGYLSRIQNASGWLVEDAKLPVNVCFNALTAFTALTRSDLIPRSALDRLLSALVTSKGATAPQSDLFRQDNSLQGWSWVDATFSWAEPTAWGTMALKKARGARVMPAGADARIQEAERLLLDRVCQEGGWNYGNANVLGQNLHPQVPTTALVLLALQDRRTEEPVLRSLAFLERAWDSEVSAIALGLSAICLQVYGRPVQHVRAKLEAHLPSAQAFGNIHGLAVAALALSKTGAVDAFRL